MKLYCAEINKRLAPVLFWHWGPIPGLYDLWLKGLPAANLPRPTQVTAASFARTLAVVGWDVSTVFSSRLFLVRQPLAIAAFMKEGMLPWVWRPWQPPPCYWADYYNWIFVFFHTYVIFLPGFHRHFLSNPLEVSCPLTLNAILDLWLVTQSLVKWENGIVLWTEPWGTPY